MHSYDKYYEFKNGILDINGKIIKPYYIYDYLRKIGHYQEQYEYCQKNWGKSE